MMKKIQPKILIPIIFFTLLFVGLAVFFVWPREGKVPEITTPEEATPPSGIVWNVSAGQIDPKVEEEVKKAVYSHAREVFTAIPSNRFLSIEELEVENEWGILTVAPRYQKTNEFIGTEGLPLIARKVEGKWIVVDPGDKRFFQWVPLIPETLLLQDAKEFLMIRYGGEE